MANSRTSAGKAGAKARGAAVEPFAEFAEPNETKAKVERTTAATPRAAKRRVDAPKKAVGEFLASPAADPFAETADTSVPKKVIVAKAKPTSKKAVAAKTSRPAGGDLKVTKPAKVSTKKAVLTKTKKMTAAVPDTPVIEPVTDPVPEPASEPVILPPTDPTNDPVPAPITEPLPEPTENPDPAPVTDPPLDPGPVYSAAFKLLAQPTLPELPRGNRARLQMQTPTRIYFYWSLKQDPWSTLRRVFGDDLGSYSLVLKLTDLTTGREDIRQAEAEGNYWFDVEPDRSYQAEIGFYAPNRPYFRVIHSNTVQTPRRSPSPRAATESDWKVSAAKFAEVLDVAGFSRDAADVALAGDDVVESGNRTTLAFSTMLGTTAWQTEDVAADELRHAMLSLASGVTLEELKFRISASLFAVLQANAGSLEKSKAMNALTQYFEIDEAELAEEQFGPAVFGASLVNFPKTLRTRTLSPKYAEPYSPVSSHSIG